QDPLAASFAAGLARLRRLGNLAQEELHEQDVLLLRVLSLLADGRIDVEEDADRRARMPGYDEMHVAISSPRERTAGDVLQQCKPAPTEFRYPGDCDGHSGPEKTSGTSPLRSPPLPLHVAEIIHDRCSGILSVILPFSVITMKQTKFAADNKTY